MRQIKISGQRLPTDKIGSVFLADADIDMDVFRSQMRRFGKPKKPFYVVVSKDDRALRFSSIIAGGRSRLGDDANIEELAALGATVIDLTDVKATDPSNHSKYAQLADVAPKLTAVLARGVGASPNSKGNLPEGGALGAIVELPTTPLNAPIRIISAQ
jgi:esterase/lipase superfamily enzyme